jgi:hypothetical protein
MQTVQHTPRPCKPRGKPFTKGFDSRRHQFTQEERSRGFWTAIAKLGISAGQKLYEAGRWPNFQGRRVS